MKNPLSFLFDMNKKSKQYNSENINNIDNSFKNYDKQSVISANTSCNCGYCDYCVFTNYTPSNDEYIKEQGRLLRKYYRVNSILSTSVKFVTDSIKNINYINSEGYELYFNEILIRDYILTGNMFFLHKKNKSSKKIKLQYLDSLKVELHFDDKGFLKYYEYDGYYYNTDGVFIKKELENPSTKIDTTYRLCHIKNDTENNQYLGLTELTAIITELKLLENGKMHNLSLLKNGASPSGILSMSSNLTDEQILEIKNNMTKMNQGVNNSGTTVIIAGGENVEYQALSKTNKDMDYSSLNEAFTTSILNIFKISPSMIGRSNHDTHNNSDVGFSNFWNYCCLPLLRKFQNDFNDKSGYIFDKFEMNPEKFPIEALKTIIDVLNKGLESNCFTMNELRSHFGMKELVGGGVIRSKTTGNPIAFDKKENIPEDSLYTDYLKVKNEKKIQKQ